jgi:hypothetical protein
LKSEKSNQIADKTARKKEGTNQPAGSTLVKMAKRKVDTTKTTSLCQKYADLSPDFSF